MIFNIWRCSECSWRLYKSRILKILFQYLLILLSFIKNCVRNFAENKNLLMIWNLMWDEDVKFIYVTKSIHHLSIMRPSNNKTFDFLFATKELKTTSNQLGVVVTLMKTSYWWISLMSIISLIIARETTHRQNLILSKKQI